MRVKSAQRAWWRVRGVSKATLIKAGLIVVVAVAAWAGTAVADHTRFWREDTYDAFERGTAKGIALRSDGVVMLAPKFAQVADPNLAYLRTLRVDSHGAVYAGGGSNAKVIRVDASGKSTTVFDSTEMTAQALALDKSDNLYVATSPDGKIYKVTPSGQRSVFFDPKSKYIWDLVFGPDGTLYAGTGDTGKIYAVTPDGKGEVFYDSDETHIRALALDGKGNLIAGTEPDGRVIRMALAGGSSSSPAAAAGRAAAGGSGATANATRVSGARSGYVLYETAKREVTSIISDGAGNLYVAAIGDKRASVPAVQPQAPPAIGGGPGQGGGVQQTPEQQLAAALALFPSATSSAVYHIGTDGAPEEIWTSPNEIVYAVTLTADGKPLLGVGNQGAVIELFGNRVFSRLAKTETGQVTGFARASGGKIFVATANPGKMISLGPELEAEGTLESATHDARIFSRWGRLTWWGQNAASGAAGGNGAANAAVQFYVRSGNTSDAATNWSAWSGPYASGAQSDSPASRFVQWKAVLHGGKGPAPEISWVNLAYLPKNVAPRITAITVQNPGVRVTGQQGGGAPSVQLRMPSAPGAQNQPQRAQNESASRFEAPPQASAQKGAQSVIWSAEDDNEDDLTYSVYYRGENEKNWKLLKDKLEQRYYTWDTTTMPDGAYYLKIEASDAKSNPPADALSASRESERFVVDNTPPQVTEIAAQPGAGGGENNFTIRFRATDSTSDIVRAQYSLDAADWITLRPTGDLSDSPSEQYIWSLPNVSPGEHTVSVRVYDQYENEAAGKVTFTAPTARR